MRSQREGGGGQEGALFSNYINVVHKAEAGEESGLEMYRKGENEKKAAGPMPLIESTVVRHCQQLLSP